MADAMTNDRIEWARRFTGLNIEAEAAPGGAPACTSDDQFPPALQPLPQSIDPNAARPQPPQVSQDPSHLPEPLRPLPQSIDPNAGTPTPNPPATPDKATQGDALPAIEIPVSVSVPDAELDYVTVGATFTYTFSCKPPGATNTNSIGFKNGKLKLQEKFQEQVTSNTKFKSTFDLTDRKGSVGLSFDLGKDGSVQDSISFEFVELDGKKGKAKFATLKYAKEITLGAGTMEADGVQYSYTGVLKIEVTLSPAWAKLAEYASERLGLQALGTVETEVIVAGAFEAALAAITVGLIAGVAQAVVQGEGLAHLAASVGKAVRSFRAGLQAGLSNEANPANDALGQKGWSIGSDAYAAAAKKLSDEVNASEDQRMPLPEDFARIARAAAAKAISGWSGWPSVENEIRWSFFRSWVDANHGVGTFEGDAQMAVLWCFGVPNESPSGEHMKYWAERSSLPKFMTN